ncbi:PucR family transcriptional regulator ligand-binding domain-containing protein [Actinomadura sp. NBRC 104412]|uniref:PucR family transcriptional regulator ligand-binding domain-containing protein n=1 Tax=Actinomadura sp. NBRC 104412 TaxID=3032203 RepID=UPI0033294A68
MATETAPAILRVADLLAHEDVPLTLVAGQGSLGRRIRRVRSTDLPDPGGLVRPGDLVLTTGRWYRRPDDCAAFASALAERGAAALVVGLDRLGEPPGSLAAECERRGLPLLTVDRSGGGRAGDDAAFGAIAALVAEASSPAVPARRRAARPRPAAARRRGTGLLGAVAAGHRPGLRRGRPRARRGGTRVAAGVGGSAALTDRGGGRRRVAAAVGARDPRRPGGRPRPSGLPGSRHGHGHRYDLGGGAAHGPAPPRPRTRPCGRPPERGAAARRRPAGRDGRSRRRRHGPGRAAPRAWRRHRPADRRRRRRDGRRAATRVDRGRRAVRAGPQGAVVRTRRRGDRPGERAGSGGRDPGGAARPARPLSAGHGGTDGRGRGE